MYLKSKLMLTAVNMRWSHDHLTCSHAAHLEKARAKGQTHVGRDQVYAVIELK